MTDATPDPAPGGVDPAGAVPPDDVGPEAPIPGGATAEDAPTVGAPGDPVASADGSDTEGATPPADLSVEALLDDVERLTTERDEYLDRLRRTQADFENSKKRLGRDAEVRADAAAGRLVEDLLPVLDACDGAMSHGEAGVEPVFAALLQVLEKNGLERIDPAGDVFDPTRHEAVMHEPAGEGDDPALSLVVDVLRIGYAWRGRVVRAAMVKVRG
ncbi:MAG: nucleotide exchange factor GrpE [Iamia sp.]